MLRSLGTLLVIMNKPPGHGLMNSEWMFDLALLSRSLMRPTCTLASFMMRLAYFSVIGTIACFLEGPLVVIWILLLLLAGFSIAALWISIIFLLGSAGKASLILRMFSAVAVTCANVLIDALLLLPLVFSVDRNLDFFSCSSVGRGGRGGGTFLTMLPWGSFEVEACSWWTST